MTGAERKINHFKKTLSRPPRPTLCSARFDRKLRLFVHQNLLAALAAMTSIRHAVMGEKAKTTVRAFYPPVSVRFNVGDSVLVIEETCWCVEESSSRACVAWQSRKPEVSIASRVMSKSTTFGTSLGYRGIVVTLFVE